MATESTPQPSFRSASELPALVSYVRDRRCILFVGAGLSRPAGYPGWGELMRLVVDATVDLTGGSTSREDLDRLLAQGKFAEAADQCRTVLGRTFFGQVLRRALARDVAPPEATHRAIVETPYACIVTTNFDTLLEDAFARWSDFGIPKAPTGMGLAQHGTLLLDGAFFILKAHGSIEDDASMVFTSEDYRRITHANPAFQAVMSSLLLSHAVLFVGYSLGDPNFRLLMDSQLATFGSDAPPRYALMENVGATEREILRRTTGIEVISFPAGAYGEVAGLLRYLADASAPPPAAPAPREVLRATGAAPAHLLKLEARDVMVDRTCFVTTTRDLAGSNVPLHHMRTATSETPPWHLLSQRMSAAIDHPFGAEAVAALQEVGALLAQAFPGLDYEMRESPPGTTVLLDLPAELAPLPWEWLPVGGKPLGMVRPVCRTIPGLDDRSRGRPLVRAPLRALLIGDTLADAEHRHPLPHARAEVAALAERLTRGDTGHEVTLLVGREASYARVLDELRTRRHDVVHFAGVSHYDDAGSYLILHDGRVHASELVTLLIKRPPALLVINALYSGFVPAFCYAFPLPLHHGMSFDDHYRAIRRRRIGFDRAAARAGVGTFVGAMGTTGDESADAIAQAFYDALLRGRTAAEALFDARHAVDGSADTTALQLTMAGYADLRLVAPVPPPTRTRSKRAGTAPATSRGRASTSKGGKRR
jgi:hypothetical protein